MPPVDWNLRYRTGDTPWDLGAPSPIVLRVIDEWARPPARVLVPGCGLGNDAIALAERGFDVVALDLAPLALDELRHRSDSRHRIETVLADFLALPDRLSGCFDLVVEHTCLSAIPPGSWSSYVASVAKALRPGGLLAGAFLWFAGGGPPFGTNPDELTALLHPLFAPLRLERAPEPFPPVGCPQLEAVFRLKEGTPEQ